MGRVALRDRSASDSNFGTSLCNPDPESPGASHLGRHDSASLSTPCLANFLQCGLFLFVCLLCRSEDPQLLGGSVG